MIGELRITGLGVIEESVLELGPGLCVVTGETGAGKTMLVTALGLLLGSRADSGVVRSGSRHARVEGRVGAGTVADQVDALGGEVEDDQVLLVRQVSAEGRSRAFVGGAAAPVSALAGLADQLVAVHGQSDQHRLLRPGAQRAALDRFAGTSATHLLGRWVALHGRLDELEAELHEVVTHARERAREGDLLRLGLDEVEAAAPRPGEDLDLAAEETRLGFADTLRAAAEAAREALSSDEDSPDALGTLAAARSALESVREHDPVAAALAERVREVGYLLVDVAGDVASYATDLDTDPARLAAVSQRRSVLTDLLRKYGDDVDSVLEWARVASLRLLELDGSGEREEALRAEREEVCDGLVEVGCALTEVRDEAASRLSVAVGEELTGLAMPHARLEVRVRQHDVAVPGPPAGAAPKVMGTTALPVRGRHLRVGSGGFDEIEILLAANTGAEPRPLHKGASGGELSRVMLALEVVLGASSPVPTFVFDEVDAGVGGKAAVEVGRRLARLAQGCQVLVVTHLPQVAAFADRHVVVRKAGDGSVTTSGLTVLDDAGRVGELSRMMAGQEESDTAMAHAEELLDLARRARATSLS